MNSNLNKILILLVEDNEKDRELLTKILAKYFTNILQAENGEIAYEIFKKNKNIDLIISNINMPGLSGMDLLKLVRMTDMHIPFLITTANLDSKILIDAIDLNVSSYLIKPIKMGKLLEKVDFLSEKINIQKKLNLKQKEIENYIEAVDKVSLIFRMTENGNITYMNESMMLISKYKEGEIKELFFNDIIHPDIPKKYIEDTWSKIKNDQLWNGNTKFISKEKETFYLNNTIFKIKNLSKEEYITIAFLNTKENLKKRDFQRKVLLAIQDGHKKENDLKKEIITLNGKIRSLEKIVNENSSSNLSKLQGKLKKRDDQVKLLEKEIIEASNKYEKMLKTKREEVEIQINAVQKYKIDKDKQFEEMRNKKEELDAAYKEIISLQSDISKKDKIIKDLRFIIDEIDNKK